MNPTSFPGSRFFRFEIDQKRKSPRYRKSLTGNIVGKWLWCLKSRKTRIERQGDEACKLFFSVLARLTSPLFRPWLVIWFCRIHLQTSWRFREYECFLFEDPRIQSFRKKLPSDLNVLLQLVSQQRQHCETLSFHVLYEEEERLFPGVSAGVVRSVLLKNSWKLFHTRYWEVLFPSVEYEELPRALQKFRTSVDQHKQTTSWSLTLGNNRSSSLYTTRDDNVSQCCLC